MGTRGGFAAWTERAKDVIVDELRSYLSLNYANVLAEMPQIERYGLAGQTTAESFVNIYTALPHKEQRIPFIAVMSTPGQERKMGIGRQVVHTFHDPTTGLPMVRECVGGDFTVVVELAMIDTNQRSELTDIVFSFFTEYMEQHAFAFLGDGEKDPLSGVPNLYQIILKSTASLGGETDQPRPEGEPFNRIYYNRITVPVIFLDYVDREVSDFSLCFNPTLELEDDENFKKSEAIVALAEPTQMKFVTYDNMETSDSPNAKWRSYVNVPALVFQIGDDRVIKGNGSLSLESIEDGATAALASRAPAVTSGRLRLRFRLGEDSTVVLYCMAQGIDPLETDNYHLIVKTGDHVRMALVKGPIGTGAISPLAESSWIRVTPQVDLTAQIEWKVDVRRKRIRIRASIAGCDSSDFGSLVQRLEVFDTVDAFLSSQGEGFGFRPHPDTPAQGYVVIDDPEIMAELNTIEQFNPAKVG